MKKQKKPVTTVGPVLSNRPEVFSWSDEEELIIATIQRTESVPRAEAIRRMRRRKLDDLKGRIRPRSEVTGNHGQGRAVLRSRGAYVTEACDRCGLALGPVHFTRRSEPGIWCSRLCRDGVRVQEPGTCRHCKAKLPEGKRRGAVYCDESCRVAAHRGRMATQTARTSKISVTKPSIYAAFSPEKQRVDVAVHPGTGRA